MMNSYCLNGYGNTFIQSTTLKKKHLRDWTCDEVALWLKEQGFDTYISLLSHEHKIDGKALSLMTEEDLRLPPLSIKVLGDLKHISFAISNLQKYYFQSYANLPWATGGTLKEKKFKASLMQNGYSLSNPAHDSDLFETELLNVSEAKNLRPEIFKTIISLIYFFCVSLITSCVMVIVHDRVPDMDKYPPLPDIFLDNVPLIPWAFQISEVAAFVLVLIMITILVFHKHRFIILRRFFALTGTVFLLRCVTMLITSLSVPGTHLKCVAQPNKETWNKVLTAFQIWRGAGLSIQGVRTCGDYMYSGHTSMLTMLNFFITEYTSRKVYFLHTFTWILNMFGIFFILAAHEHYSIDVFIAFYITSRLFMYYHTLANNRSLMCDAKRTKIWFPMLAYFECNVNGMVPNEFEWPFTWQNLKSIVMLDRSLSRKSGTKSSDTTMKKRKRKNYKKHDEL